MSDQQDKPTDVNDVENAKVVEDVDVLDSEVVEVLDSEIVEETTLEPGEAVEAELVSDEQDPLAGLDMIKQLATAQEEIASLKDQMLRTVADSQNTKRRAEQDVTKARKFGTEKFANEMLPIVDSLAMALQSNADNEAAKTVNEGVEMTLSMLLSALEKFNVVAVDPQGEVFNPELHQAMSMVDGGEAASNTVIAVMQKGFTISGRLLRPAMVMVAK